MARALLYLLAVGLLAAGAAWLADRPGEVTFTWLGYRIDTSVGVLAASVFALAVALAVLAGGIGLLRRVPRRIREWRARSRRRAGYAALTQGLVAVAAGDVTEARRLSRRAEGLLKDPPLTMLLSAQAAQLAGDEQAARGFFTAMLDEPEMAFLGLRGLISQAIRRGDRAEALTLVRRAYRLKPSSEWVSASLVELEAGAGRWADAEATLQDAMRRKLLPPAEGRARRAAIMAERARLAADGDPAEARGLAARALRLEPGLPAAALVLARLADSGGRKRRAARAIERAWAASPVPELVPAYLAVRDGGDRLAAVPKVQRLVRSNPAHLESRLALAQAALDAGLWGEARAQLDHATAEHPPSARVLRLLAEVEEQEHGDLAAARRWLMQASLASPDPRWSCAHCAAPAPSWQARCEACGRIGTLAWRAPAEGAPGNTAALAGPPAAGLPAIPDASGAGGDAAGPLPRAP